MHRVKVLLNQRLISQLFGGNFDTNVMRLICHLFVDKSDYIMRRVKVLLNWRLISQLIGDDSDLIIRVSNGPLADLFVTNLLAIAISLCGVFNVG